MATTLTSPPDRFTAGTTVRYMRSHALYPASAGWALSLHLSGGAALSVSATPTGDAFDVLIPAALTANAIVANCTVTAAGLVTRAAGSFIADNVSGGWVPFGPGIPRSNRVDRIVSATQLQLTGPCTAGSGVNLVFMFPKGIYSWNERVALASEAYIADTGTVSVDPDPNGAPATALQSWEEEMIPIVQDIIAGKITSDTESYQIADRAKTAVRMSTMLDLLGYLKAVVAGRRNPGKIIPVRAAFTGAGSE